MIISLVVWDVAIGKPILSGFNMIEILIAAQFSPLSKYSTYAQILLLLFRYFGPNCAQKCLCANDGTCDPVTGICDCLSGWSGPRCEIPCTSDSWGPNCQYPCQCQNGFCDRSVQVAMSLITNVCTSWCILSDASFPRFSVTSYKLCFALPLRTYI